MTRRVRRVHLAIWAVIGPLMIAGIAVGLARRPTAPPDAGPTVAAAAEVRR